MLAEIEAVLSGERRWCVVTGDAADIVPTLAPEATRFVLCDPPYGSGHYRTDRDVVVGVLRGVAVETLAIKGYPTHLFRWLHALGQEPAEWIVWFPSNYAAKAGGRWKGLPKWHEDIAVCGRVPGAKRCVRERSHVASGAMLAKGTDYTVPAKIGDVWEDAAPAIGFLCSGRIHPNESPLAIMLRLVELCTNPGELILDPFCGSGTIGVAAVRLGRRYVGIEIEPKWAELSLERMLAEESGSTLQARRAGQVPLFGGRA